MLSMRSAIVKAVYLMAVGGAAYLSFQSNQILRFGAGLPELGMEAIYEFDVRDMPVTVAVDSSIVRSTSVDRPSGKQRSKSKPSTSWGSQ